VDPEGGRRQQASSTVDPANCRPRGDDAAMVVFQPIFEVDMPA
jgi:hypothetical protein